MEDNILSYREMCDQEGMQTLQRGMNYLLNPNYSVILMSQRKNAPYDDIISPDGFTIEYEGHDVPKTGAASPEIIRVYEKLFSGVWSERGFFRLTNYHKKISNGRNVFRFTLEKTEVDLNATQVMENTLKERTRVIPSEIKKRVWKRDGGKCILCGATDELHFDHDLPYSKGGTSITEENVRILCARHNLKKSHKIE
jgi:hypothetical protein